MDTDPCIGDTHVGSDSVVPDVSKLTFYVDKKGHLICAPYSIKNLHVMADSLGIKRCWFHKSKSGLHHYDVPKRRRAEMEGRCCVVSSRRILAVILASASPVSPRSIDRWFHVRY